MCDLIRCHWYDKPLQASRRTAIEWGSRRYDIERPFEYCRGGRRIKFPIDTLCYGSHVFRYSVTSIVTGRGIASGRRQQELCRRARLLLEVRHCLRCYTSCSSRGVHSSSCIRRNVVCRTRRRSVISHQPSGLGRHLRHYCVPLPPNVRHRQLPILPTARSPHSAQPSSLPYLSPSRLLLIFS